MYKKIVCFVLIFLSTYSLLVNCVQAESGIMPLATDTFDGLCYRYVEPRGFNQEHNGYEYYYRLYLSTGLKEGVIYLPEEYYNKNWLLFLNTAGAIRLITCDTPNLTFCMRYGWANGRSC